MFTDKNKNDRKDSKTIALFVNEGRFSYPYIDKLLEIKGIGMITVCGFISEVGDIRRFQFSKNKLQRMSQYSAGIFSIGYRP